MPSKNTKKKKQRKLSVYISSNTVEVLNKAEELTRKWILDDTDKSLKFHKKSLFKYD